MMILWSSQNGGLRYIQIRRRSELSGYELTVVDCSMFCDVGSWRHESQPARRGRQRGSELLLWQDAVSSGGIHRPRSRDWWRRRRLRNNRLVTHSCHLFVQKPRLMLVGTGEISLVIIRHRGFMLLAATDYAATKFELCYFMLCLKKVLFQFRVELCQNSMKCLL